MRLNDIPRAVWRFWPIVLVVTVVIGAASWAWTSANETYSSRVSVSVVGTQVVNTSSAEQVSVFIKGEFSIYAALSSSPAVLKDALTRGQSQLSVQQLHDATSVSVSGQTLDITVTMKEPGEARKLAFALGSALSDAINTLHEDARVPIIEARPIPQVSSSATATNPAGRSIVTGALFGFVLGCIVAIGVARVRQA